MNYRHAYHAGNFADVLKHAVLALLVAALARKDKGFVYFETHAGAGCYDLQSPEAAKTGEYADGIARLWQASVCPELDPYLAAVRRLNGDGALRYYPGSPRVARALLRPQDRMQLAELEPSECARLKREFASDRQVRVDCADGYAALKGWLPPREARGVVMVDPPYESPEDWRRAPEAVIGAHATWPTGVYALWYPVKRDAPLSRLRAAIGRAGVPRVLHVELAVWPIDTPFRLNGAGMVLVNPPWQLDAGLTRLLPLLAERLRQGPSAMHAVEWWAGDKEAPEKH